MNTSKWNRQDLEAAGFRGFVTFGELPGTDVPRGPGVYAVLRESTNPPLFLKPGTAGRFKDREPSVAIERLTGKWVKHVDVVYIGKATPGRDGRRGLRQRLDEYRRIGAGEPVGHWGGRFIWQLGDSRDLLVAWKETPGEDAGTVESRMLAEFIADFDVLPFANLRR